MPANETQAKLQRAKDRLYVLCQAGGWGMFLLLQVVFSKIVPDSGTRTGRDNLTDFATYVMVITMGLVLTHYARPFMTRRGWKQLGWRALVPRILGMAAVLSFLWNALGYGYTYLIVGLPWPGKASPALVLVISWLNGTILFICWLCLYFFYHIFERLNRMQVEQLRLAANVKEAELRALKSQVNPHFLFNSLNSLRALIDEDAPRAREAVTRLANMLRYSLQSGQLETVPFEEELRIVEDYVALEQIRHENRLHVRWDITEEVRSRALPVPPMLLQTLVENAVKYGIGTRREGGEITIAARIDGAVLHIRVTNPGELDAPVSPAVARAGSSTGVGLRNASERLKLLFGDRASLALLAEPRGSVTANVKIPLNHT
ncbi:MAG TPA: sensor histidine kinase [Candidatus Didemnitutus sp.]|nr:sensor histidine kinase [Candidatus Didemnitutus sp.]